MPPAIGTPLVCGREKNDCAITVLAMYLGVSYEDVLRQVAVRDVPYQGRHGLRLKEIERIARAMRTPLKRLRRFDILNAYGMLSLPHHIVLLRSGVILDPEPGGVTMWEVEDYFHAYPVNPGVLLVAREDAWWEPRVRIPESRLWTTRLPFHPQPALVARAADGQRYSTSARRGRRVRRRTRA
jgi:hypothetical protein